VRSKYEPLTETEVVRLLERLCVDLGFCLTADEAQKLETDPPATVDSFTRAVLKADGKDSEAHARVYGQVAVVVAAAFARASGENADRSQVQ
jgi:hypothetical protein